VLRRASDCWIRQALQQSTPHGLRSSDVRRASGLALRETKEQSTTEATSRVLRAESPALSRRASTDTSSAIDPQTTVIATQCPLSLPREDRSAPATRGHGLRVSARATSAKVSRRQRDRDLADVVLSKADVGGDAAAEADDSGDRAGAFTRYQRRRVICRRPLVLGDCASRRGHAAELRPTAASSGVRLF